MHGLTRWFEVIVSAAFTIYLAAFTYLADW